MESISMVYRFVYGVTYDGYQPAGMPDELDFVLPSEDDGAAPLDRAYLRAQELLDQASRGQPVVWRLRLKLFHRV